MTSFIWYYSIIMKKKLPAAFLKIVNDNALKLSIRIKSSSIRPPIYNNKTYYKDVTRHEYYDALILVRHYIKIASDIYFDRVIGAQNVDLFMLTPSVSSPMGPGSDSEAIPIKFGKLDTYLVDSSQFGFEPLLLQNLNKVYCYLPSMRGEMPDARHLNQFFHCEAEISGTHKELIPIIEGYVRALADVMLALEPLTSKMSINYSLTNKALKEVSSTKSFNQMSFDKAYDLLSESKSTAKYTQKNKFGRGIDSHGEKHLTLNHNDAQPLWLYGFDRDTVAFYQKPDPQNTDRVINADLLFPPLIKDGFGGEILGSGQRQDTPSEMIQSLKRQGISSQPYEWYMDLRNQPNYKVTSGFGLGIERFIAWSLGYSNIRDVILYPRLKNVLTLP